MFSALVRFLIVSFIGMTSALRSFGSPPDVIFNLPNGLLEEREWRAASIQTFFARGLGPTLNWDLAYSARYPAAASGGSYIHTSGSANNGSVDFTQEVYLGWPVDGSLSFPWPWLDTSQSIYVYVRGPAGTQYSLDYQGDGTFTEQFSSSIFGQWQSTDNGATVNFVGWGNYPKVTTNTYSRTDVTSGDPVVFNGVAYTLATVLGPNATCDHNGDGGGEGPVLKIAHAKGRVQAKVSRFAPILKVAPNPMDFGELGIVFERVLSVKRADHFT